MHPVRTGRTGLRQEGTSERDSLRPSRGIRPAQVDVPLRRFPKRRLQYATAYRHLDLCQALSAKKLSFLARRPASSGSPDLTFFSVSPIASD